MLALVRVAVLMAVVMRMVVMPMPAAAFIMVVIMPVMVVIVMMIVSMSMRMVMVVMAVAVMAMIVIVIVMMAVPVIVAVRHHMLRIGAAFRIERRLDLRHLGAEAAYHVLDDVIATDPQLLTEDLGRKVTIAEMPGDAHEVLCILRADFGKRLGRRKHFHEASVFQRQRVAGPQHDRFLQIEQEFEAANALHGDPPAMPVVEIEHDRIDGLALPRPRRHHLHRTRAHAALQ